MLQLTQPICPPITSLVRHHAANNSQLSTHRLSLVRHNASSNKQFVHLSSHLSDTSPRDGLAQVAVDQRQLGSSQPVPETNTSGNANWSLHASKQTWTALAISSEVRVNWITGHGKGIIVPGSKTQYTTRTSRTLGRGERSVTRESSFPAPEHSTRREQRSKTGERSVHDTRIIVPGSRTQYTTRTARRLGQDERSGARESPFPAPEHSTRREQRSKTGERSVHDTRIIVPGSRTQYTTRTSRQKAAAETD